jgi:hypothetical protein
MERCKHCRHGRHEGDCQFEGCGCVKFEAVDVARREERKRLWVVTVSFLTRRGWSPEQQVRVRAGAFTGAAMRGIREARRCALPPKTRIAQARLTVLPVARTGRREVCRG